MGTAADWQASSVQLAGLMKQVKARSLDAKVLAKCSPATQEAFKNPYSARWHSGEVLVEFSELLVQEMGQQAFADLNYDMTKASFGPILGPMLQVALAITGRSPATVLARVPTSAEQALKNVKCSWTSTGPKSGTLGFEYPCPIKPDTEHAWRGALRFISELSGSVIKIDKVDLRGGSALFLFVSWT